MIDDPASDYEDESDNGMQSSRPEPSLIGLRTAIFLYAVLVIAASLTLKGKPLYLALIIIAGLAAKSCVHYFRERDEK